MSHCNPALKKKNKTWSRSKLVFSINQHYGTNTGQLSLTCTEPNIFKLSIGIKNALMPDECCSWLPALLWLLHKYTGEHHKCQAAHPHGWNGSMPEVTFSSYPCHAPSCHAPNPRQSHTDSTSSMLLSAVHSSEPETQSNMNTCKPPSAYRKTQHMVRLHM